MAGNKSRLGRGLSGLISGGVAVKEKQRAEEGGGKKSAATRPVVGDKEGGSRAKSVAVPAPPLNGQLGYAEIPVGGIDPNPFQPRREFDPQRLDELAASIRSEGLLQPVIVRKSGDRYQLIAGERRWRACQKLNLKTIPAMTIEAGDATSASISLIENLQRADLNPVEESLGYASLIRDFDLTQEEVAERVGKGRATVANALRLLQLNAEIRGYLSKGLISPGHAKLLLGVDGDQERTVLARKIIEEGLSVRSVERLAKNIKIGKGSGGGAQRSVPNMEASAVKDIEKQLGNRLNTRVALKHSPKKGRIVIEYYGNDDLQRILEKIGIAG